MHGLLTDAAAATGSASALKRTVFTAFTVGCGLFLGLAARGTGAAGAAGPGTISSPCESPASRVLFGSDQTAAFGQLPLRFEANQGQSDDTVKFVARSHRYTVFLTPTETVVVVPSSRRAATQTGHPPGTVVRMQLLGANGAPEVAGVEELPGKVHYFLGKDPRKWRTNVPTYAKVAYRQIYPGVDLVYYGHGGDMEYDFVVAAGADPTVIRLGVKGADTLELTAEGDLILRTGAGEFRLQKPFVYQDAGGTIQAAPARYVIARRSAGHDSGEGSHEVEIHVAAYDRRHPLIIDPVLSYATYVGGTGDERGAGIAVDAAGAVYVTGETTSVDFPKKIPSSPRLAVGRMPS